MSSMAGSPWGDGEGDLTCTAGTIGFIGTATEPIRRGGGGGGMLLGRAGGAGGGRGRALASAPEGFGGGAPIVRASLAETLSRASSRALAEGRGGGGRRVAEG